MKRKKKIDSLGATALISFSAMLGLNQVLIKIVNDGLQPVFQAGLRSVLLSSLYFLMRLYEEIKLALQMDPLSREL